LPDTADTIVLGAALGLDKTQVMPFLDSLRHSGYAGDVALVVDRRLAQQLEADSRRRGVVLVRGWSLLPVSFLRLHRSPFWQRVWTPIQTMAWGLVKAAGGVRTRALARAQGGLAELVCTPMEARFLRYERLLAARPYDHVLICDVRDVVFQRDPFVDLRGPGLAVSLETRRYTIEGEPLNAKWVRDVYGEDVLDRIGANPVSCVGVTYGDRAGMSLYLRLMREEIVGLSARAARQGGADTAIHNHLVWSGRLDQLRLLETLDSPVATLNGISEQEVSLDSGGRLLNRDGSEPSVVHQYDRLPAIAPDLVRAVTA
jgi:hypothetical protein